MAKMTLQPQRGEFIRAAGQLVIRAPHTTAHDA